MRVLTISLALGIIAGATWLYVVPPMVWLPIVLALALGTLRIKREWLAMMTICIAMAGIGIMRSSQSINKIEKELNEGYAPTLLERKAKAMQGRLEESFAKAGLEGDALAIATAMTLGDKTRIDRGTKDTYSRSGASHVLALSGMHLSIIYVILILVVTWLPRRIRAFPHIMLETCAGHGWHTERWARICRRMPNDITVRRILIPIVIATIWIYTFIVGMGPSVVRSAAMLTIASAGMIMWRRVPLIDSLTLAAFVMLLFSPLSLYDVGFQMSFLAVLGIFLYFKALASLFKTRTKVLRWIWAALAVAVSAQIFIIPIVAHYFHRISCYGLLTSPVLALTALLIVWLGIILLVLVNVFPSLTFLVTATTKAATVVVTAQNSFLEWVVSLPYSSIEGVSVSTAQLLLIYLMIVAATLILKIKGLITYQEV